MANKVFWTSERIIKAYEMHYDFRTLSDLADELSRLWDVTISRDAIQNIFKTHFKDKDIRMTIGSKLKVREFQRIKDATSKPQITSSRAAPGDYSGELSKSKHFDTSCKNTFGDLILEAPKERPYVMHIWPDAHVPDHDPAVMEACLLFAEYMKPDAVVDLGDFLDLGSISSYGKNALVGQNFKADIDLGRVIKAEEARRLDRAGITSRFQIMGNHEIRLHKWLVEKAPQLYEITPTIGELLELKQTGWQEISYNCSLRIGDLQITHGRGHSKNVASRSVEKEGSIVFGHVHRMQMYVANTRPGNPEVAFTCGTRGSLIKDYQYHEPNDHVHGMGIVTVNPDLSINATPIILYQGIIRYSLPGGKILICDGNTKSINVI